MKKKTQAAKPSTSPTDSITKTWFVWIIRYWFVWIILVIVGSVISLIVSAALGPSIKDYYHKIVDKWDSPKIEPPNSAPSLGDYPPIAELAHPPSKEDVKNRSRVPPEKVVFSYRNDTGIPMKLLMFNWYYRFFPPKNNPIAPTAWNTYDLPATTTSIPISDFSPEGTGWYTFYVQRIDTGKRYQIDTHNIFYSELPLMIISKSNDPANPFTIKFTVEDDQP